MSYTYVYVYHLPRRHIFASRVHNRFTSDLALARFTGRTLIYLALTLLPTRIQLHDVIMGFSVQQPLQPGIGIYNYRWYISACTGQRRGLFKAVFKRQKAN